MDALGDKEFLQKMMANRCPCGGDYKEDGEAAKDIYDKCDTLAEFVDIFRKWLADKYGDTIGKKVYSRPGNHLICPQGY